MAHGCRAEPTLLDSAAVLPGLLELRPTFQDTEFGQARCLARGIPEILFHAQVGAPSSTSPAPPPSQEAGASCLSAGLCVPPSATNLPAWLSPPCHAALPCRTSAGLCSVLPRSSRVMWPRSTEGDVVSNWPPPSCLPTLGICPDKLQKWAPS